MNTLARTTVALIGPAILILPLAAPAFDSGSTGADGAFNPQVSTELQLPSNGVFNFSSVNIPTGVTVTFKRNAANTPVVFLVQGDVLVDGTIDVSGKPAAPSGPDGSDGGDPANDGNPGAGGPGGFDGGYGTPVGSSLPNAGDGLGPGGGGGGLNDERYSYGGEGGFGTPGDFGIRSGGVYGSPELKPLVGGSGGGGSWSHLSTSFNPPKWLVGMGGGGGGGAILIAASGSIGVQGSIVAYGGESRPPAGPAFSISGGAGSGGAIRLVATVIFGGGAVRATGGFGATYAGDGRIRVEPETGGAFLDASPTVSFDRPTALFTPGLPGLAITSIAAFPVPANPTGHGDITLPAITADPVDVVLHTNGVPPDTIIKLTVTPEYGAATSTDSAPTVGTLADASTTVSVSIPEGRSVLMATTSFIVTAALGERLAPFAQGETLEQVRLTASPGQPSRMVLLTASGRELDLPAGALAQGW
jgi:hypothetical protein